MLLGHWFQTKRNEERKKQEGKVTSQFRGGTEKREAGRKTDQLKVAIYVSQIISETESTKSGKPKAICQCQSYLHVELKLLL